MMWIGTHVLGLIFLACIGYGSGDVWRRRRFATLDVSYRPLANLLLGLALWTAIAFFLAATQLLSAPAVLSCLSVVVIVILWDSRQHLQKRRLQAKPPAEDRGPSLAISDRLFLALLALIALVPLALLTLVPTVSWDASAYHLTVPRLYLDHGGFRPVELNVYSNWPLGTEMLFGLAMLLHDHVLAKLLHFAFGLATLYALFVGVRRSTSATLDDSGRVFGGLLAMVCFLATGVVAFEMRVAYIDLAVAFYFTAAFLFLRRWQEAPNDRTPLILAGISCGLMAGSKLNGFVGIVALAWLLVPTINTIKRRDGWGSSLRSTLYFAMPIGLLWFPWLIKSLWTTGNPFYPLLYGVFGGTDWSHQLASQLAAWQQSIGMGRDPIDYLLLPLRVIVSGGTGYERFDGELGVFWLVLLPVALWVARCSMEVRRLLAVAATFFVLWAFTSQQLRLLIPIVPLCAMACGLALAEIFASPAQSRRRIWRPALLVVALLMLAVNYRTTLMSGWNAARRMVATPASVVAQSAVPPIFSQVDALPEDSKLLFLNTNQGFFCQRPYLADSFFEASQINHWLTPFVEPTEMHHALRQREISHVLLDRQPRPVTYPPSLMAMLQDRELVASVNQSPDGRFLLFALR